jgi:hypothetical protein
MRGPKAKASTKIERVNWASASHILRPSLIADSAGAIMLPDMSVTRPPRDVRRVTAHFHPVDQL